MQRVWQQMRSCKRRFVPAEGALIFGASINEIEYDARQLLLREAAHCGDAVGFALQCILMHLLSGPERLADSHQFAQAAQTARRFRAGIDLRPGGIRDLSHIQVAAGIDREAMRGDELIEFLACSNIADAAE